MDRVHGYQKVKWDDNYQSYSPENSVELFRVNKFLRNTVKKMRGNEDVFVNMEKSYVDKTDVKFVIEELLSYDIGLKQLVRDEIGGTLSYSQKWTSPADESEPNVRVYMTEWVISVPLQEQVSRRLLALKVLFLISILLCLFSSLMVYRDLVTLESPLQSLKRVLLEPPTSGTDCDKTCLLRTISRIMTPS